MRICADDDALVADAVAGRAYEMPGKCGVIALIVTGT
jgi:hypothetical protein